MKRQYDEFLIIFFSQNVKTCNITFNVISECRCLVNNWTSAKTKINKFKIRLPNNVHKIKQMQYEAPGLYNADL